MFSVAGYQNLRPTRTPYIFVYFKWSECVYPRPSGSWFDCALFLAVGSCFTKLINKSGIQLVHRTRTYVTIFSDITEPSYFIPHHCVFKPDGASTLCRIALDANMKAHKNISLNGILYTEPKFQNNPVSPV